MKVFISQPMDGKEKEEIEQVYQAAVADIRERIRMAEGDTLEFLNTRNYILPKQLRNDGCNERIAYLSHAIQVMSRADVVYFCEGAEKSQGCACEHAVAKVYGIPIMRPEGLPA